MRKFIIVACFFGIYALVGAIEARPDTTIYQTIPGTQVRDYSKPALKIENDGYGGRNIYQTLPGTNVRDYNEPGLKIESDGYGNDVIYKTLPGTSIRDYTEPGIVIESDY